MARAANEISGLLNAASHKISNKTTLTFSLHPSDKDEMKAVLNTAQNMGFKLNVEEMGGSERTTPDYYVTVGMYTGSSNAKDIGTIFSPWNDKPTKWEIYDMLGWYLSTQRTVVFPTSVWTG